MALAAWAGIRQSHAALAQRVGVRVKPTMSRR
jgi:hypothetical protein